MASLSSDSSASSLMVSWSITPTPTVTPFCSRASPSCTTARAPAAGGVAERPALSAAAVHQR
eukprot:5422999-Pyramimonas_sp.AAC.1